MAKARRAIPGVTVAGLLLAAATTCLTVSYAGAPSSTGLTVTSTAPGRLLLAGDALPLGGKEEEEEEKREELENESEKNHYAERAERAREQTERDAEQQNSSRMVEDRAASALLRAQIEVIESRDAMSGQPADPCVHAVLVPPAGAKLELRISRRRPNGAGEDGRVLHPVARDASCALEDGFILDEHAASPRLVLCPSSCEWARAAPHGLRVEVMVSDL